MNVPQRKKKYKDIVKYLTTPIGLSLKGKALYPTLEMASLKFGYHPTHIFRIKKTYLGLAKNSAEGAENG